MAEVLAKDDTLGTALEQMKAAQDLPSNIGHLITISEAFWWEDVVPQIDQAVRHRISPREDARYISDPERPALLQLIREHEIGGRPVEQSLDRITARSMQGARSIAAVLHGRLEKAAPPARGETQTFAERVPGGAAPQIGEVYQAADARQAEIGRELAERARRMGDAGLGSATRRAWGAARRLGAPGRAGWRLPRGGRDHRPEAGDRARTGRQGRAAGDVQRHRPDPGAARRAGADGRHGQRGPRGAPGRARARRGGRASGRQCPAGLGRASARSRRRAGRAGAGGVRRPLARSAEALAAIHDGQLASLRVADAAHREWAEAHAGLETSAMAAARELRARPGGADPGHGCRGGRSFGAAARDARRSTRRRGPS